MTTFTENDRVMVLAFATSREGFYRALDESNKADIITYGEVFLNCLDYFGIYDSRINPKVKEIIQSFKEG